MHVSCSSWTLPDCVTTQMVGVLSWYSSSLCICPFCNPGWVTHIYWNTLWTKEGTQNMCDDHNIWRLWREIKTCFTKNTHKTQSRNGDKTKVCKKKSFSMMTQSLICVTLMNWSLYWSVNMMMDSHDVTNNWTSRAS